MKFFKHYTDAHSGQSLMEIGRILGMAGIGQYWTLVEACAAKMEWDRKNEPTIEDCVFQFDRSSLCFILRSKPKYIGSILRVFAEYSNVQTLEDGNNFIITVPKLLECLDRDYKRARPVRGQCAPKKENKKENKNKKEDLNQAKVDKSTLPGVLEFDPEPPPDELGKQTNLCITLYCALYAKRYKHNPKIGGKNAGIIKKLIKDHNFNQAFLIIESFMKLGDPWLVQQSHPIALIDRFLNQAIRYAETGKLITRGVVKEVDDQLTEEMTPFVGMEEINRRKQLALTGEGE